MTNLVRRSRFVALFVALWSCLAWPVYAHNERIHQAITDYAYHIALAMSQFPPPIGGPPNLLLNELAAALRAHPELAELYAAAQAAIPKLRALPSGLPEDPTPCNEFFQNDIIALVDVDSDNIPDWPDPFNIPLEERSMSAVTYPVTVHYGHLPIACGIDGHYTPGGALVFANPTSGSTPREQFMSRDYTGVTLGYWAASPDRAIKDWIFRSTTLETIQNPVITTATGAGVSSLVTLACLIACGLFPPLCAVCPALAIGAGAEVIDALTDFDASAMEHDDFVGLGHHLDVKPLPPSEETFDDEPGKFSERAGPNGNPDLLEEAVIALYDLLGWHVRHDLSQGPKNYQIFVNGTSKDDFHADSSPRSAADWETEIGAHIQYTPVDNLALFGWLKFKAKKDKSDAAVAAQGTRRLGWPLHAIGDVSSSMHVIGASGYGHRPYEDSIEEKWDELVFANSIPHSLRQIRTIVERALPWRQFIQQWRADHGGTTDVPVRDLVTALAQQTRAKSIGVPGLFNAGASVEYFFGSETDAIAAYNTAAMTQFQRDSIIDAIAVTLVFLISATEVTP
jgi:hypothetical protein